jgi:hypothetical protein
MKTRINTTHLKRLALLEKRKDTRRPICLWPRVMGLDEWEAVAIPIQQRLLEENLSSDTTAKQEQHSF